MVYFVVEMPVNKDDQGPETDPSLVTKIYYEIWDETFMTISRYETQSEAHYRCSMLNTFEEFG